MSAAGAVTASGGRERPRLLPTARATGWTVGLAALVLFAYTARLELRAGTLDNGLGATWAIGQRASGIGGQWLVALALDLARRIPGAGPWLLVAATVASGAAVAGWFTATLRRRHWPVPQAALAGLLLALHPVVLWLATTGTPALPATLMLGRLILASDRAEAIGDARSLMGLGLALAFLFVVSPEAIELALPVLLLLPVALHGMDSPQAALALLLLVVIPTVIVVGGVLLATASFGHHAAAVIGLWAAPLHGSLDPARLGAAFFTAFGGRFFASFAVLLWLCPATMPPVLVAALRLALRRSERARPATALLTLLLAPLAGAATMLALHADSPLPALAAMVVGTAAWTTTVNPGRRERLAWLALMAAGDLAALHLPWLWDGAAGAWLKALLAAG